MHLGYQAAMRGLVFVAGWYLIRRTGSARLSDLAGSGGRMPLAATLFGFGMFSVMGLSPFKGSFSKFIVLYAAIEQGQWLMAIAGTLATIVAAVYYMLTIQRVCLERPERQVTLAPGPQLALPLAFVLTALTVVISLWPAPFVQAAAEFAGLSSTSGVPQFETPWTLPVLVPYLGGFAIYCPRPGIGAPARCGRGAARDCNGRSCGARTRASIQPPSCSRSCSQASPD